MLHPQSPSCQTLMWRRAIILGAVAAGVLLLLRKDVIEFIRPTHSNERMEMELRRAAERADLCTAANATGVGLRGEYFSNALAQGAPKLVRVDEVIDFDRSSITGLPEIATQPVSSVRWSGWIKAPFTGAYHFHADTPNMRITVANKLVAGGGATAPEQKFDMAAGRFYPIEVVVTQVTNSDSDARIRLEWTAPHGARYVVPKALLHLPTETVTPHPKNNLGATGKPQ